MSCSEVSFNAVVMGGASAMVLIPHITPCTVVIVAVVNVVGDVVAVLSSSSTSFVLLLFVASYLPRRQPRLCY